MAYLDDGKYYEIFQSIPNGCILKDNGMGIDLQVHGKEIFSLYKRFHTHTEGRGLGLHLVKMQAIALGGSVDVSSQPGVGSIFTVYIKTHPERIGSVG